jgi:hypothetical protein
MDCNGSGGEIADLMCLLVVGAASFFSSPIGLIDFDEASFGKRFHRALK